MFDRHAKIAFVIAGLTLAGSALGFQWAVGRLNVYLKKEPVEMRSSFSTIPDVIGEWKKGRDDEILPVEVVESLGTNQYLERTYLRQKGRETEGMRVHAAYYTGMIDAVPHVPDRCMVAGGFDAVTLPENVWLTLDTGRWHEDPEFRHNRDDLPFPIVQFPHHFTGQMVTVRLPLGDFELRTTEFNSKEYPGQRIFAGYLFIANGYTTPTPDSVRLLAFRPAEKYAYYCKVQFNMTGPQRFTREEFVKEVSGFLNDFLPQLMRCLPDWAEVQSSGKEQPVQQPA